MIQVRPNTIEWEQAESRKAAFRRAWAFAFGLSSRIFATFWMNVLKPLVPLVESIWLYIQNLFCFVVNICLLVSHTVHTFIRAHKGEVQKPMEVKEE